VESRFIEIAGAEGERLKCLLCGHQEFETRSVQLNTPGVQMLGMDWMNEAARCHVCERCGHIHWFVVR